MTYAAVVACAYWLHAVKDATPIQGKVYECFVELVRPLRACTGLKPLCYSKERTAASSQSGRSIHRALGEATPADPHPLTYLLDVL